MSEKDTKTKEYMSDNRRFAEVFNFLIYDGKPGIDATRLFEFGHAGTDE